MGGGLYKIEHGPLFECQTVSLGSQLLQNNGVRVSTIEHGPLFECQTVSLGS